MTNPINLPVKPNKLNIGCGRNHLPRSERWCNLDLSPEVHPDLVFDLNKIELGERLPFPDNTFEHFNMSHVLEHLPRPLPILKELHRVAKPDATFLIRVPYGASDSAFEDPTHVRQYFPNSFSYFGQPAYARADYGYRGDWRTDRILIVLAAHMDEKALELPPEELHTQVQAYRNFADELIVILKAVKPIRSPSDHPGQINIAYTHRNLLDAPPKPSSKEPDHG